MLWALVFGSTLACIVTVKTTSRGHANRGLSSMLWLGIWTGAIWAYAIMSWWYGGAPAGGQ